MEELFFFLSFFFSFLILNVHMNSSFLGCKCPQRTRKLRGGKTKSPERDTRRLWSGCHPQSIPFLSSSPFCVLESLLPPPAGAAAGLPHTQDSEPRRRALARARERGRGGGLRPPREVCGLRGNLPSASAALAFPGRAPPPRGKLAPAGAAGSRPPRGLQTASESREGLEFSL